MLYFNVFYTQAITNEVKTEYHTQLFVVMIIDHHNLIVFKVGFQDQDGNSH
jgi:hypothetical protein